MPKTTTKSVVPVNGKELKPTVRLTVNRGATLNVGNYESERIDVSIEKVVLEEEVDFQFEKIMKWCEKKITEKANCLPGIKRVI